MVNFEKDYEHASSEFDLTVDHIRKMIKHGEHAAAWSLACALTELAHKVLGHTIPFGPQQAWESAVLCQTTLESNDQTRNDEHG